eukprot:4370081-Pyramimonas_sp.AAC.1
MPPYACSDSPRTSGGAAMCDVATSFKGCWGGPLEFCFAQIHARPRHVFVVQICEPVVTFEGCCGVSGVTPYARPDETSPSLGA